MTTKKNHSRVLITCLIITLSLTMMSNSNPVNTLIKQSLDLIKLLSIDGSYNHRKPYYELIGLLQKSARKNHIKNNQLLAHKAYQQLLHYPTFQFIEHPQPTKTSNNLLILAIACQNKTAYELLSITTKLGIISQRGVTIYKQCENAIKIYNSKKIAKL